MAKMPSCGCREICPTDLPSGDVLSMKVTIELTAKEADTLLEALVCLDGAIEDGVVAPSTQAAASRVERKVRSALGRNARR